MKIMNKLAAPAVLATSMAVGAFAAPGIASAEVSASAGVANFYLWRGLDVSAGTAQVSGSVDYAHDSGAYAGIWASSTWAADGLGTETDVYFGFAGELQALSYDISFWNYMYPEANGAESGIGDTNASELVVSLGIADFGLGMYFGNDNFGLDDWVYTTLDYTYDKFNFLYGTWKMDTLEGFDDSHLTISYAVADNFTFTITKGKNDDNSTLYDEDVLYHISYSLPIEM